MAIKFPLSIRRPRFSFPRFRGARGRTWLVLTILVLIIIALAFWRILAAPDASGVTPEEARRVTVATVAALSGDATPLSTIGTVRSSNEAELRAKRAGSITSTNYQAGDRVSAGTIIATIENAAERASLAQAQARVSGARANLLKVEGGTREEQLAVLAENVTSAENTLAAARTTAHNAILAAYAGMENGIRHGVDVMFENPDGPVPNFKPVTTESTAAIEAENQRVFIGAVLDERAGVSADSASVTVNELSTTEQDLQEVLRFVEKVLVAIDGAIANATYPEATLATYATTAQSAQSSLLSSLSSVASARATLQSAQSALTVAEERLAEGTTGAQSQDRAAAAASLAEAQAGLAAANAAYEHTVIRTPISGTLASWSVSSGDFVSVQQELGVVVNEGALEVVSYVPPRERLLIAPGNPVLIDGQYDGIITNVATGLDTTRNLIAVTVGVSEAAELVHGQTVSVSLTRTAPTAETNGETEQQRLPLSAIKLLPSGAVVFTVDETDRLVAIPVTLGDIVGSAIVIENNLATDTVVVVDARGLSEGDLVTLGE